MIHTHINRLNTNNMWNIHLALKNHKSTLHLKPIVKLIGVVGSPASFDASEKFSYNVKSVVYP